VPENVRYCMDALTQTSQKKFCSSKIKTLLRVEKSTEPSVGRGEKQHLCVSWEGEPSSKVEPGVLKP